MKTINTPLKRSAQLSGLSREHHDGLLFVWKLKQGMANNVPAQRLAEFCSWYMNNHLQEHMEQEERTLTSVLSASHPLMNNMLEDHDAIRQKIEKVTEFPSYEGFRRLHDILYYHIRFEERVLFPAIEKVATTEQLDKINAELADQAPAGPEWTDEFWTRKIAA